MMSGVSYVAGCCLLILGSFAAAEIQLKIHWVRLADSKDFGHFVALYT